MEEHPFTKRSKAMKRSKESKEEELEMTKCKLSKIPKSIFLVTNIKRLHLYHNLMPDIPPRLCVHLTNLTELNMSSNRISSIPPEIKNLTRLAELLQNQNNISCIPAVIGYLTNLTTLNLQWNLLFEIPPSIGNLLRLRHLLLGSNSIHSIPEEMGDLTNLTNLRIGCSPKFAIPSHIGRLSSLELLDMTCSSWTRRIPEVSSSQERTLGMAVARLTRLKTLILQTMELESIPIEAFQLDMLEVLDMRYNNIPNLLCPFGTLTRLENSGHEIEFDGTNAPKRLQCKTYGNPGGKESFVALYSLRWSPSLHRHFSHRLRQCVEYILLAAIARRRLDSSSRLQRLPRDILLLVFSLLQFERYIDFPHEHN
jgi:Leucine-rich repeat (LRR) protein